MSPAQAHLKAACRRIILAYAAEAALEASRAHHRTAALTPDQTGVQAARAAEIARRLTAQHSLVLDDPVGTGKTVVALAAARVMLEDEVVRQVLVVAPSRAVRNSWEQRARWAGLPPARAPRARSRAPVVFATTEELSAGVVGLPRDRSDLLLIVDEAHRGLHRSQNARYQQLRKVAAGARVLLVTATPFQLSASGLASMLEVGLVDDTPERQQQRAAIEAYGNAVVSLIHAERVLRTGVDDDGALPHDHLVESAREQLRATDRVARPVLTQQFMSPYPRTQMGLTDDFIPPPQHPVPLGTWGEAYHVARLVPELVTEREGKEISARNSDNFMRMLVSSTAAFRDSQSFQTFREKARSAHGRALLCALEHSLGEAREHPKVALTAGVAADALERGQHVLVFCNYVATQPDLAQAVAAEAADRALKVEVRHPTNPAQAETVLRDGFGEPVSRSNSPIALVVRDNLSESIDLDGGRPVVIHHDLTWSPVRYAQRMGRVVRASTGFQPPGGVIVPVLEVPTDRRLYETLIGRRQVVREVVSDRGRWLLDQSADDDSGL